MNEDPLVSVPTLLRLTPPYYAVIFTSVRTPGDEGYSAAAEEMLQLARKQPGFLGFESARQGLGISISYWASLEAIESWKHNSEHRRTQPSAQQWYSSYRIRVCRVEREYGTQGQNRSVDASTG